MLRVIGQVGLYKRFGVVEVENPSHPWETILDVNSARKVEDSSQG